MKLNNILNILNEAPASNYIPINSKTHKSAKILTHKDLDGLVSGLLIHKQLQKQGIPGNRIEINFGQYGDSDFSLIKNVTREKRGQGVVASDFSALPKADYWETFNKIFGFKGDPKIAVDLLNNFNKIGINIRSEQLFKESFKKLFHPKETQWLDDNLRTIYRCIIGYAKSQQEKRKAFENLQKAKAKGDPKWIKAAEDKFKSLPNPITIKNVKDAPEIELTKPLFVTDHHADSEGKLTAGQTGAIRVSSKSNAAYIAQNYCQNIMTDKDINAINMIDSAEYTTEELENTVFLKRKFGGPDRTRNLAILLNTLVEQIIKTNPKLAEHIIRTANPSVVSIYNTVIKAMNLNEIEIKAYDALAKGDMATVNTCLSQMPDVLTRHFFRTGSKPSKIKHLNNESNWARKNKQDIFLAKTGHKSEQDKQDIKDLELKKKNGGDKQEIDKEIEAINSQEGKAYPKGSFMVQDAAWNFTQKKKNGKEYGTTYPGRFYPALVTVDGKRKPYTLKKFGGFFQVAKNPLYTAEVDFEAIGKKVINDVDNYLKTKLGMKSFQTNRIIKVVKKKSGGHKAIFSVQGFDQIKPPSDLNAKYFDYKGRVDRLKKINSERDAKNKLELPKTTDEFYKLKGAVDKYNKRQAEVMEFAINKFMEYTEKEYPEDPKLWKDGAHSKNKMWAIPNTDQRDRSNVERLKNSSVFTEETLGKFIKKDSYFNY